MDKEQALRILKLLSGLEMYVFMQTDVPEKTHTWETVEKNPKLYVRPSRGKPSLAFLHKSAIYDIPEFMKFVDVVHNDMSLRSLCPQTFAYQFYSVNK